MQFGVVAIAPFQPLFFPCASSSFRWSALTSGIMSGTSGSILCELASLTTVNPALANSCSISLATSDGRAEKTTSHPLADSGVAVLTFALANSLGDCVGEQPVDRLAVLLPRRLASHQDLEADVRVLPEHVDVPLPDRAGRAQQSRSDLSSGFLTIIASRMSSRAFSAWFDETKTRDRGPYRDYPVEVDARPWPAAGLSSGRSPVSVSSDVPFTVIIESPSKEETALPMFSLTSTWWTSIQDVLAAGDVEYRRGGLERQGQERPSVLPHRPWSAARRTRASLRRARPR